MAKDKDKDEKKDQEDKTMLSTRNDPDEPKDPDVEPDAPEQPKVPDDEHSEENEGTVGALRMIGQKIAEQDEKILSVENEVKKLKTRKKTGDIEILAGALKAMAGLALSPDGFAAFKQMAPYLFEE